MLGCRAMLSSLLPARRTRIHSASPGNPLNYTVIAHGRKSAIARLDFPPRWGYSNKIMHVTFIQNGL